MAVSVVELSSLGTADVIEVVQPHPDRAARGPRPGIQDASLTQLIKQARGTSEPDPEASLQE
jgi:hypothetical protein